MTVHPYITAANYTTDYIDYAPCVGAPTVLEDFIQPCFLVKKDDSCNEIILQNVGEYNGLEANATLMVSIWYRPDVNDEFLLVCNAVDHPINSTIAYPAENGAGYYELRIEVTYDDNGTIYTSNIVQCITLDCCSCDIEDLKSEVKEKITKIGCKLHKYESMGKSRIHLETALYGLTNVLYYLNTTNITEYCSSAEKVQCYLNSIKDFC